MNFIYKLEHKFGRFAIRNLSLILILCYVAGYIIKFAAPAFMEYLTLNHTQSYTDRCGEL